LPQGMHREFLPLRLRPAERDYGGQVRQVGYIIFSINNEKNLYFALIHLDTGCSCRFFDILLLF
jgi:hypothetical protein